jgi:hypothetical protein
MLAQHQDCHTLSDAKIFWALNSYSEELRRIQKIPDAAERAPEAEVNPANFMCI